jgi:hypothetical protein
MADPIQRARDLVSRASHPGTPEEEARSCAVQACRLIREHKLLDRIGETPADAEPQIARIMVDMVCVLESADVYKFCLITPDYHTRGSSQFSVFPKRYVVSVAWMADDEKKRRKLSGRVAMMVVVDRAWLSKQTAGWR